MTQHDGVARRFALLLDALQLDRAALVIALDHAVSERSLYSILNGHRRPSRSLAVLIERTWGFRADYLLSGEGEMWSSAPQSELPCDLNGDQAEVLEVMARSRDHIGTRKRDLGDAVLWSDLWQRTTRMLEELAAHSEHPNLTHADLARVAFSECMDVADGFASMAKIKHHRRIVHLVASFITRILDHDDMATNTLPELLARAQSAEQQLAGEEQRLRKGLTERAETHTPLQDLDPNESHQRLANALLSNTISSTLDRAN